MGYGMAADTTNILKFEEALLSLNSVAAQNIISSAFTEDNAFEIINDIIAPVLEKIGDMWVCGDIALSQEYMAGKMCEEIVEMLLPSDAPARKDTPVIGITTLGDEHMLGKRIVTSFIRASGFNIHDYGEMGPENVAMKVEEDGVDVLMVSTLMLNLAYDVKKLREIFDRKNIGARIIVGGAPFLFDRNLWKEVGADAMAVDAMESISKIHDVLEYSK